MIRSAIGLSMLLAATAIPTGEVRSEITVAAAGPMTGEYAAFGAHMERGARMAIEDINAAGGTLGEELELTLADDACDPRQAVSVANDLVNTGVSLVVGHFCSGASIAASQVYNEEGILMISPASTSPQLTEQGFENVFRVVGRDDQQGEIAGRFLAEHFGDQKIAIVHDKSAYGMGLAQQVKQALNEAGVQETMFEAYTAGEQDYSPLVSRLKQNGIDVLYIGGYHTEAGLIARQMDQQGMDVQIVAGDALVTDEYWSITGDTGEGTLITFGPDPDALPAAREVVERFRAQGYEPEGYTLYTYAALQIFDQAAEKAGSTDYDTMLEALRGSTFDTVLGPISFDEKGDVEQPAFVFYRWHEGQRVPAEENMAAQ